MRNSSSSICFLGLVALTIATAQGCASGAEAESTPGGGGATPGACSPEGTVEYCYPGPAVARGVGECRDGTRTCSAGSWGECENYILPGTELCDDSLDNDCDGIADESCACEAGATRFCYTGPAATRGVGSCADGEQSCIGQLWSTECVGQVLPDASEPCTGTDANCNGVVDDGCSCTDQATQPCYGGPPATRGVGQCRDGLQTCTNGEWEPDCAGDFLPAPEVCNNADDDCDGTTDEELATTSCGVGPCDHTISNCVGGQPQTCNPLEGATTETCNNIDDDCDGTVDDGNPGGGSTCNSGQSGICAAGHRNCEGGNLVCVPDNSPTNETCNNLDDNCNGQVDDGLGSTSCGVGQCFHSQPNCVGGVTQTCNPMQGSTAETCDGVDNDCDNTVDDGNLCNFDEYCDSQLGYCVYTGTCPFLYTWDGTSFAFEADIYGSGKLGTETADGIWKAHPDDFYVLGNTPAEVNGAFELRFVEERTEVNYFDFAALIAADVPEGLDVYAMLYGVNTPFVPIEQSLHTVDEVLHPPLGATHINTNTSILSEISATDGVYAVLGNDRNTDFDYDTVELDLGALADAPQIKLVIDGVTAFPNSAEGFARKKLFGARTKLEVLDANGQWVAVPSNVAYLPPPKEVRRPFVMDITDAFITNDYRIRLTFLYKTHLDGIFLDTTPDVAPLLATLTMEGASLDYYGHSLKVGDEIFQFQYGPANVDIWPAFPGFYTRYGDITNLLGTVDDKFAIYWAGDQVTLRFVPPPPPAAGTRRRYVLHAHGYYKDSKYFGTHTVDPLPFTGMSTYPYDIFAEHYPTDPDHTSYRQTYNTRWLP